MKRWLAWGTVLIFVLGLGLWEMGAQAGNHFPSGLLLAKKDKEKEEEKLEAKEKELNAKEEALKKKEEELKKWEGSLKQRSKKARQPVQPGAGLQPIPGTPSGFSPKTINPQAPPQPNLAAPKGPSVPVPATPPRQ